MEEAVEVGENRVAQGVDDHVVAVEHLLQHRCRAHAPVPLKNEMMAKGSDIGGGIKKGG